MGDVWDEDVLNEFGIRSDTYEDNKWESVGKEEDESVWESA